MPGIVRASCSPSLFFLTYSFYSFPPNVSFVLQKKNTMAEQSLLGSFIEVLPASRYGKRDLALLFQCQVLQSKGRKADLVKPGALSKAISRNCLGRNRERKNETSLVQGNHLFSESSKGPVSLVCAS